MGQLKGKPVATHMCFLSPLGVSSLRFSLILLLPSFPNCIRGYSDPSTMLNAKIFRPSLCQAVVHIDSVNSPLNHRKGVLSLSPFYRPGSWRAKRSKTSPEPEVESGWSGSEPLSTPHFPRPASPCPPTASVLLAAVLPPCWLSGNWTNRFSIFSENWCQGFRANFR